MIVLASTSQTRQHMLLRAGVTFSAIRPDVDERLLVSCNSHWSPAETALKLAQAKALDVSVRFPDALVIGADQVLALGDLVYSKPASVAQCRQHLRQLRGKTHSLISSVVCARSGSNCWSHTDEAFLTMRSFTDEFLEAYLQQTGTDCTSSVGGYKIEGTGLQLFEEVRGDYFTILGLPLIPLLGQLRSAGEIAA
jgi:septum formation protein